MSTLANKIEQYLKRLLTEAGGMVELKRSDLAETFLCVPSQINYVLETRFSSQQGYLVESRRGGGGFIRIVRLSLAESAGLSALLEAKEQSITQQAGELLLQRLVEEEFLTKREGMLVTALLDRNVLTPAADCDHLRGSLLNALLLSLLREDFDL